MSEQRDLQGRIKFEPRHGKARRGGSVTVRLSPMGGTRRNPGLPAGRAYAGEPCPVRTRGGAPWGRRLASHLQPAEPRHRSTFLLAPIFAALFALVFASNAGAAGQRNFVEEFGPAQKPSIEGAVGGIAIDQATGDVYIPTEGAIRRFHADGTPAPFAALGTNVIDGAESEEKPCSLEPASCDVTPQERIVTGGGLRPERLFFQIAIDESGGATDGDIYLSQSGLAVVDVFSGDGRYLEQLNNYGGAEYRTNLPEGVAVDASGNVYVSDTTGQVNVFAPRQNPVTEADFVRNIAYPTDVPEGYVNGGGTGQNLAIGRGSTAGSLFVAYTRPGCVLGPQGQCEGSSPVDRILQLDIESGAVLSEFDIGEYSLNYFAGTRATVTINPTNGNVVDGSGREFEVRAGADPVEVSHLDPALRRDAFGPFRLAPGLAVDGSGQVILSDLSGPGSGVEVYGLPATVPSLTVGAATEVTGTRAVLPGTVDPAGLPLAGEGCYFEYGPAQKVDGHLAGFKPEGRAACEGPLPSGSEPSPVQATVTGLEPGGHTYGFRLVAVNRNGQEETSPPLYLTTTGTVVTEPASSIGLTSVTLNGSVRPEGRRITECTFEYGLSSSASYEKSAPCNPAAGAIAPDFRLDSVTAAIGGLQGESTYRFRLLATFAEEDETGGEVEKTETGEEESFDTSGVPRILESRASGADQGSVTLEAGIDPSGFGTRYRFEWGPTAAYGNVAPAEFEPFIGSGSEPVPVKARITGLAPGTAYHYRVVAESVRGSAESPDQIAETLNSCGLPEGRCFEEVSRGEAGPVAIPGEFNANIELHFQAAAGSGGLAYPVESGYPEATKGADVLYRGLRTPGGWESTQLSAPFTGQSETVGVSQNSEVKWLSDDLSCGFLESTSPLTPDPSMKLVLELGGSDLYRVNPDGSYTAVSTLPPLEAVAPLQGLGSYNLAWASRDCGVTVFGSTLAFPGVPAVKQGSQYLYEWRDGSIRDAGVVPGPGGEEVAVGAVAGAGPKDTQNSVSADGSRIFFTAPRQTGRNPAEVNEPGSESIKGIFVREDGRVTRDVSQSETAIPDEGAHYQWATEDGSKVFFIANTGLAAGTTGTGEQCTPATGEGCELYEYDLGSGDLTDRTYTRADKGAEVRGFLGASADGSRIYFASRNRLLPGYGRSRDQNVKAGSYSIYSERGGVISFAGSLGAFDVDSVLAAALIEEQEYWVSQVSPDGRYLLFESQAQVTDYRNEGLEEVYLHDAATGRTTCVSCRQDGKPSDDDRYGSPSLLLLQRKDALHNPLRPPHFLTERDGQARVFFTSPDPLAPGAVAGQNNVYEWSHDQVFRLVGAPAGSQQVPTATKVALFAGASDDASDIYLITPETLTWEDGDERQSAYDARIGGGFPEPPGPAAPCRAGAERSCVAPPPPSASPREPGSTGDTGSREVERVRRHRKNKHHRKKHAVEKHLRRKKSKEQTPDARQTRAARNDRRGDK